MRVAPVTAARTLNYTLKPAFSLSFTALFTQVSGSKFYYLKGAATLLELGLVNWAMSRVAAQGFTTLSTPDLVRCECLATPHCVVPAMVLAVVLAEPPLQSWGALELAMRMRAANAVQCSILRRTQISHHSSGACTLLHLLLAMRLPGRCAWTCLKSAASSHAWRTRRCARPDRAGGGARRSEQ